MTRNSDGDLTPQRSNLPGKTENGSVSEATCTGSACKGFSFEVSVPINVTVLRRRRRAKDAVVPSAAYVLVTHKA